MRDVIDRIRALPNYQDYNCEVCGAPNRVHSLQMYKNCGGCGVHTKVRGFAEIGAEIQDVIDEALTWAGITQEEVLKRHAAVPGDST